jgi:hypothetical protein
LVALGLLGAAVLQLFDIQPLKAQITASIAAGPGAEELDRRDVARVVAGARHVEIVPSFHCSVGLDNQEKLMRANMDLMLATARINVPTNTVYLSRQRFGLRFLNVMRAPSHALDILHARHDEYCKQEIEYAWSGGRPGEVIVLLSDRLRTEQLAAGMSCSPLSWARYCKR